MNGRSPLSYLVSAALIPVFALSLLVPSSAVAENVTVQFEATVFDIADDDQMLGDPAQLPTTLTGTYRYDRDAVDLYEDDPPLRGEYEYEEPPNGFVIHFGPHEFVSAPDPKWDYPLFAVSVNNESTLTRNDSLIMASYWIKWNESLVCEGLTAAGLSGIGVELILSDNTGTAIPDEDEDQLPDDAPNLPDWGIKRFIVGCVDEAEDSYFRLSCDLTSAVLVTEDPLEQLSAAIRTLVEEYEVLSEEQAHGLVEKLLEADAKFDSTVGADKTGQACNQMLAFINQVNALTPSFIPTNLPDDLVDAELLISLAIEIMEDEQCTNIPEM